MEWFTDILVNVFIAAAILVAAVWLSSFVGRQLRALGKQYEELDETLFGFLASIARYTILIFAGIFVLARFGVQTTSLVALVGAAGLAIGLALQGTLSNLAAGVMLLGFRPFKIGDYITAAGESGTVKSIRLFTVELVTPDNVQVTIPNGDIWASSITNYSIYDTRRAEWVFGVSYDSDLKKAEKILHELIEADERSHMEPAPFVKVTNLGDSSVDFTVRVWCDRSDHWNFKCDMTRAVKDAFDKGGIDIPYPTVTQIQVSN
jgi:small conductance mechanosensitive channel